MNVRGFHFLLALLLLFPVAGLAPARAEVDDPNAAATNVLLTVPRKDYSIAGLVSHLPGVRAFKYGSASARIRATARTSRRCWPKRTGAMRSPTGRWSAPARARSAPSTPRA